MTKLYFVRSELTGAIKIGISTNIPRRLKELTHASGSRMELLFEANGDRADEARLHRRFHASRIMGEWFTGDSVREFVDLLRSLPSESVRAELQRVEAHSSDDESIAWHREVNEIVMDACFAFIRENGIDYCADRLTRAWGPMGRPVRPGLLANVLEGRNYFRAEWIFWFARKSGAVRDAIDLMIGGREPKNREDARSLWALKSSLRAEVGDKRADELIARAEVA